MLLIILIMPGFIFKRVEYLQQDDNLYVICSNNQYCLSIVLDILYFYPPSTANVTRC